MWKKAALSVTNASGSTQDVDKTDNASEPKKFREFVPANKTFRLVKALIQVQKKTIKDENPNFSDKIRNINAYEGHVDIRTSPT